MPQVFIPPIDSSPNPRKRGNDTVPVCLAGGNEDTCGTTTESNVPLLTVAGRVSRRRRYRSSNAPPLAGVREALIGTAETVRETLPRLRGLAFRTRKAQGVHHNAPPLAGVGVASLAAHPRATKRSPACGGWGYRCGATMWSRPTLPRLRGLGGIRRTLVTSGGMW